MIFYMLIGLPASGKSTFYNNFLSHTILVSTDMYVQDHANNYNISYDEAFMSLDYKTIENCMIHMLNYSIKELKDITCDQTNLNIRSRSKKLKYVPSSYKKIGIVFNVDETVLNKQLAQRPGKNIPNNVMKNMKKSFQYPTLDEGFDFIYEVK